MSEHKVPLLQQAELRIRSLDELADWTAPKDTADHSGRLQSRLLGPAQQVDARGEHSLDGVRHQEIRRELTERPAAVAAGEHSAADQRGDQLLGEKRVPLPPFRDQLPYRGGAVAPQQRHGQLLGIRRWQRLQPDQRPAGRPARPLIEQLGPRRHHQQHWPGYPLGEQLQQVTKFITGPVQVLDQHRGWALAGQLLQETDPRRLQPVPHGQRVHLLWRRQAQRETQPFVVGHLPGHHLRRIALQDPEVLLQHLTQRPVRDPVTVRQAPAAAQQRPVRIPAQPPPELTNQPRLAHSGITDDSDLLRPTGSDDAVIDLLQVRQLASAAHEHRLKTADPAGARQRQRAHELAADDPARLALRLHRRRLCELERPPRGGNCPLAHQDLACSGRLLQPGAHIDGIASDERAALPGLPNHHIAGIHTDPKRQPPAEQLPHPPLHPQCHVQRPLRIILMRHRSPKGRHHCIADELLDCSSRPLDLRRHPVVKPVEHCPDPLRILAPRKLGRRDEIREQDRRQLPLLSRHNPDSPSGTSQPASRHTAVPSSFGLASEPIEGGDSERAQAAAKTARLVVLSRRWPQRQRQVGEFGARGHAELQEHLTGRLRRLCPGRPGAAARRGITAGTALPRRCPAAVRFLPACPGGGGPRIASHARA